MRITSITFNEPETHKHKYPWFTVRKWKITFLRMHVENYQQNLQSSYAFKTPDI